MQALAVGVGDLKRVLTNIKSRGTWTEIWLETILAEVLSPDQYARNVEILPGSNQRVEFAIRLPGDEVAPVWLPIDVKFPKDDYERLADAANRGDQDEDLRRAQLRRLQSAGCLGFARKQGFQSGLHPCHHRRQQPGWIGAYPEAQRRGLGA